MVKDAQRLAQFEREDAARQQRDFTQALRLFESLWNEARALGETDWRTGLEADIAIARTLNGLRSSRHV
jgi:hypothetical protein